MHSSIHACMYILTSCICSDSYIDHSVAYIEPLAQYECHRGSIYNPVSQIDPIPSFTQIAFPRLYINNVVHVWHDCRCIQCTLSPSLDTILPVKLFVYSDIRVGVQYGQPSHTRHMMSCIVPRKHLTEKTKTTRFRHNEHSKIHCRVLLHKRLILIMK